jgi:hypothetical protein
MVSNCGSGFFLRKDEGRGEEGERSEVKKGAMGS